MSESAGRVEPHGPRLQSPAGVRRAFLLLLGGTATILALIGLFVPLLPTTPLLLLAAACFMRSSDRMYGWLTGNRWFGPIIRSYREQHAIPRETKIAVLILLWSVIGVSSLLAGSWWVRGLLLAVACLVTLHVARLRSVETLATPAARTEDEALL